MLLNNFKFLCWSVSCLATLILFLTYISLLYHYIISNTDIRSSRHVLQEYLFKWFCSLKHNLLSICQCPFLFHRASVLEAFPVITTREITKCSQSCDKPKEQIFQQHVKINSLFCVAQLLQQRLSMANRLVCCLNSFISDNISFPNMNEFIAYWFQVMILPMLVTFPKPVETTYRRSAGTFHLEIGDNTSSTVHISQMSIPITLNASNCSKVRMALLAFGTLNFWSIWDKEGIVSSESYK